MRSITWAQASARRLSRHHLADPADRDPAAISAAALGIHAQVMSAAELSVCIRTNSMTRADVRDALWRTKTLVKTRGPRGTVHLLAAADLPMWTGSLSAIPPEPISWPDEVRMSETQTERVIEAIADAVADAELTVDELTEAIVARVGSWAGDRVMPAFQDKWPRWRQVEAIATSRGALCFGPDRGRRTTYTSPRRWLPGFTPAPPDEALSGLIKRYLRGYGPATTDQFARWLGAPPSWSARLFAEQPGVERVDFDGTPAWVERDDTDFPGAAARGLRLLPYFDSYLIGCWPRTRLFPGPAAQRALRGGQAGNVPALLVNGVVTGVWHQRRSGNRIVVTVEPLAELTAAQRELLDEEVDRIGRILQGTAVLTIGPVTVGAHA